MPLVSYISRLLFGKNYKTKCKMETILDFTRRSLGMPRISKIVIAICENVPRYR